MKIKKKKQKEKKKRDKRKKESEHHLLRGLEVLGTDHDLPIGT